jgi:D-alanine transaminase
MSRVAYVNGQFVPLNEAQVSMQDRGYQFADGIYEVISLYQGKLLDGQGHLKRLERSLHELAIPMPCTLKAMLVLIKELIRRNGLRNGLVYMQVTRGASLRKHLWSKQLRPVFTMALLPAFFPTPEKLAKGVKAITVEDRRWSRCDIKSIALLPNILAKDAANQAGAYEAWQVNARGEVTEGSSSNAYLVKEGVIITHPLNEAILGGITRDSVVAAARQAGYKVDERPFTKEEIITADEAFLTSASSFVTPVVQVDDVVIGQGKPGPVTQKLIAAYSNLIESQPYVRDFNLT